MTDLTPAQRQLIESLQKRQHREGLRGSEMAERLGVSSAYWSRLLVGQRGIGLALIQGIVRAYPDLAPEALLFLREELPQRTDDDTREQEGVTA